MPRKNDATRWTDALWRGAGLSLVGLALLVPRPALVAAQDGTATDAVVAADSARQFSERAFTRFDSIKERLLQTGATPSMRDTLRIALTDWRHAAVWYRLADSTGRVSAMLNNVGNMHLLLGAPDSALLYLEQAKRLARLAHDDDNEGKALEGIGTVYSQQGRIGLTVAYLDSALVAYRRLGKPAQEASVLLNLGILYTMRGQTEAALAAYEQALALEADAPDKNLKARALQGIGDAYYNLGRLDEARPYYQQAMDLYTETGALLALNSLLSTMMTLALEETSRLLGLAVETEQCEDRYKALDAVADILETSRTDTARLIESMTYFAASEDDLQNAEALVASIIRSQQEQQETIATKADELRALTDSLCQR